MKLNVMKSKPQITDEEVHRYMDFDGLIEKHKSASRSIAQRKIIWTFALTAVMATLVYFSLRYSRQETGEKHSQSQLQNQLDKGDRLKATTPSKDSLIKETDTGKKEQPKKPKVISEATIKKIEKGKESESNKDVFVEAEPLEGFPKLYNFFNEHLKYPESDLKEKIEGVEIVSFVIDENGNVIDAKVVQSLGKSFDDEGMRLISTMPKWRPATLNGRPVPSKLSLPFTFTVGK